MLRGRENVKLIDEELNQLESEAKNQTKPRTMWSVIRDSKLTLPLIIVCFMQSGQQLSGINAVRIYFE